MIPKTKSKGWVMKQRLLFIGFTITAILAIILAAEAISYWLLLRSYGPESVVRVYPRENRAIFHPFLGWIAAPNATIHFKGMNAEGKEKAAVITTNDEGFSTTPLSLSRPSVCIAVLGGSTMFGHGSSSNATTVPSLLERILNEQVASPRGIKVVDLGQRGYLSFQEMLLVHEFLKKSSSVDIVIAVSGRNDAYRAGMDQDIKYSSLPRPVFPLTVLLREAQSGRPMLLNGSYFLKHHSYFFAYLFRKIPRLEHEIAEPKVSNPYSPDNVGPWSKNTLAHYAMTATLAKAYGSEFIFFLQPTLYTKNRLSKEEELLLKDNESSARKSYENQFYDSIKSAPKDFHYVDLTDVFGNEEETLYVDDCHYNDRGARLVAEALYEHLAPYVQQALSKGHRANQ